MTDVINYWPDPDFRTTNRTGVVSFNLFPNPSPTVDLTGWTGSVTRNTAAKLFPDTVAGGRCTGDVTLHGITTPDRGDSWVFTGRVKASGAQTITVTGAMAAGGTYILRTVGWGDFGWGEANTYVAGASKSFEAGEEATFRIYCGDSVTTGTGDRQVLITLTGGGTFDVDGITQTTGVNDGYNGTNIPDAPLFFFGDSTDDDTFTYSWQGTPYNSVSLQTANIPKHVWSPYNSEYHPDLLPVVPEAAFHTVIGGEHRVALRSELGFGWTGSMILTDGTIPETDPEHLSGMVLPTGKNYAITYEIVKDYEIYYEGYPEPTYGTGNYLFVYDSSMAVDEVPYQRLSYMPLMGNPPYRKRVTMPFSTVTGSVIRPEIMGYTNWNTGDIYVTNCGIFEIPQIYHVYDGLEYAADGIYDLVTLGVAAGGSYHTNIEVNGPNGHPIIEYKVGAGSWTTLVESTNPTTTGDFSIPEDSLDFTVPSDATEVRLRLSDTSLEITTFDLFDAPPAFFDGDTTDGGGYSYAWSGTPYDSTSVRSDASSGSVTAKVFVGSTAVDVAEMRLMVGSTLVPITEAGT